MTTKRTFAKRLDTLHTLLKGLKPRQYDHSAYIQHGTLSPPNTCGTVGCALGHATVSGKFRGLNLQYDGDLFSTTNYCTTTEADNYFGEDAYDRIFSTNAYPNLHTKRSHVLKRIRDYALETTGYVIS